MSGPRLLTAIGRYYCLGPVFSGSDVRAIELEANWSLVECRDSEGPLFEVADVVRDNVFACDWTNSASQSRHRSGMMQSISFVCSLLGKVDDVVLRFSFPATNSCSAMIPVCGFFDHHEMRLTAGLL